MSRQLALTRAQRSMCRTSSAGQGQLSAHRAAAQSEKTTGLDPRSKIDVQNFVNELREQHDATILITTHDMDEAESLCDRVAIIDQGRIVALGATAELQRTVGALMGRETPATMNEVFMHYTASHPITEADIKRYGSWEKAFEALEAER